MDNGEGALTAPLAQVKVKKVSAIDDVERFDVAPEIGLSDEQVYARQLEGLVNIDTNKKGKSIWQIVLGNIFTFFNMLYVAIAIVLAIYEQWSNMLFLAVIVTNTTIAIVQEIKSKQMLAKLNLVAVPTVKVTRNGKQDTIGCDHVVLDDILHMGNGDGISCDCVVLSGSVEVNESILTGESEAVLKNVGDTLSAGSYIISGKCTARAMKVGKYNYIASLTAKARQHQKPRSQMLKGLRIILIVVAVIIIPMTILLWNINYNYYGSTLTDSSEIFLETLNKTSGAIISMIPAGPFLLTSMALAVSVIRLAKRKTMVQELYCIEMLARVNCLCLDKTGTITDGTMRVVDSIDLRSSNASDTIREIMSAFSLATKEDNYTARALKKHFGQNKSAKFKPTVILPFSSARKLSAVAFEGKGTFILGAPEFVLNGSNERVNTLATKYAEEGLRVLVLAHSSSGMVNTTNLPIVRRAIAVIAIEDRIRPEAKKTIAWFADNGVDVKVISGDNAITVSNIAKRVGIAGSDNYVSLEGMSPSEVEEIATKYSIFGRVSPEQKAILVKTMRAEGATVAMTGDGVNDILAMKESDCSISLAGGSDAARNVAHLVLLEDDFACLPDVVAEGRRVVNNIASATSLYFMKTIFIIFINIFLVVAALGFNITAPTPYESIQVYLLDSIVIGVPTTLLALQPNHNIIKGNFLGNVLNRCLPASVTFSVVTVTVYAMHFLGIIPMTGAELSTIVSLAFTFGGAYALYHACVPFNNWKRAMYIAVWIILIVAIAVLQDFWKYSSLDLVQLLFLLVILLAMPVILYCLMYITGWANYKRRVRATKRSAKAKKAKK